MQDAIWLALCTGMRKLAARQVAKPRVSPLVHFSLPGGMAYALRSERSVLATLSRFRKYAGNEGDAISGCGCTERLLQWVAREARFQADAVFE